MEEWKPLIYVDLDLSNRYEVSNTGKIRNIKSKKELKTHIHKSGYVMICISLGSRTKKKCIKMHKAVAYMFVNGYQKGLVVNHKDFNKQNNNADNLEWITPKENYYHTVNNDKSNTSNKAKQIKCIQTGEVFRSITDAANWCGLRSPSNIAWYLNHCSRESAGKHPITHERLTWEIVI